MWAANDSAWAIGALEALRQEGLCRFEVPVTGIDGTDAAAVRRSKDGEMAGTVAWDPMWTGGMGLSLCHARARPASMDIAAEGLKNIVSSTEPGSC